MARRSRGLGLNAYFGYTAFDLDVAAIRENRSRAYLEHRLAQVEMWLDYLSGRLRDRRYRQAVPGMMGQANEVMDFAYLQTVRRAIYDTLKAL